MKRKSILRTMEQQTENQIEQRKQNKFLFYDLKIEANFPNANNIIGKVKSEINLEELTKLPLCYHNKVAIKYMTEKHGWSCNYASDTVLNFFDCHVIDYVIEHGDGKQINIHILFFSLKREELLVPSVIKNDTSIINIINRHIMHYNNLTNSDYHNYQIELLCKELSKERILDLRFPQFGYCKTKLYAYQRDNIQWMIDIETNPPIIDFSEHKLFDLGSALGLYFNYSMSFQEDCMIPYDNFPKCRISGGIICDETGLGKTVQLLNLAFSKKEIKTLIIVPNHIKQHWETEILKHFDSKYFEDFNIKYINEYILIVSYSEFAKMDNELIKVYQRVIVDEIHELYTTVIIGNNSIIFNKLLECKHFIYRWGLTATPFVDYSSMFNIIKYLLGTNKVYNPNVGNYIMIQNQFKRVFRKNTKLNVEYELKLPEVEINDILLDFNRYERDIYNAEIIGNENKDTLFLRQLCCNVLISVCNDIKNIITPSELKKLTLDKFLERIYKEKSQLDLLISKKISVETEIQIENPKYFYEYQLRIQHIELNIEAQKQILDKRINVYESYKHMTKNIEEILSNPMQIEGSDVANADVDTENIASGKLCPICYSPFTSNIVLFIVCRHYFCRGCFEHCHALRPNQCPMCRTQAEPGEINFIGNKDQQFMSTKNSEILKIINSTGERYIIFTQFDKLIKSINNLLICNGINTLTYSDFATASQEAKDATQVIILSSNVNASGIDLSFIHNVIIMEPFENYIYGKEIEKQLIGRVHRINQTHKVNIYRLIIKDTIEEVIYSM